MMEPKRFSLKETEGVKFVFQMLLSLIVLSLCIYKVIDTKVEGEKAIYWGGITSILGLWVTAPSGGVNNFSTKKEENPEQLPEQLH